ncbi:Transposase [Bacteroides ovatus]|nr:Transposase [Bacteroides ovatus]
MEAKFRTDTVLSGRDTGKIVNLHLRQIYLQFPYFTKDLSDCLHYMIN